MDLETAKIYAAKQSKAHSTVTYYVYAEKSNGEVHVGAKWPDPKMFDTLHTFQSGMEANKKKL